MPARPNGASGATAESGSHEPGSRKPEDRLFAFADAADRRERLLVRLTAASVIVATMSAVSRLM
jgi:hypothetical protein